MTTKAKKTKKEKEVIEEQELNTEQENSEETEEAPVEETTTSKIENYVFEYRDKLVRKAAEFENYKKRTSEEFLRLIETANENMITKLLPIIDDMNRFQTNYKSEMKSEDIKKGIDLIFDKFMTILKSSGLEEIEVIGKEFNPELHEALLQVEDPKVKSDHIVDQHEKGYTLRKKVIRHSKVIVAK